MGLLRFAAVGAAVYAIYQLARGGRATPRADGLCAIFSTREQADLAIEHLVQEYRVERSEIYVEPVGAENSSGLSVSGGDAASGGPGHPNRVDAPLHGAIRVTVPVTVDNRFTLERALHEVGASRIEPAA